jgi:hypothetical protein
VVLPKLHNGRNKTFWFFSYEGCQRQANTSTGLYPSAAQMAGNLADDSAGTGIFPTNSPICQATPTSLLGLADMFLGIPISASGALAIPANICAPHTMVAIFRTIGGSPHRSLNFGLRYEYAASPTENRDKSLVFAPDLGTVVYANQGVRPSIVDPDWNNFAPRFGFAYRPGFLENTVVRGGFGIYYATDNFNSVRIEYEPRGKRHHCRLAGYGHYDVFQGAVSDTQPGRRLAECRGVPDVPAQYHRGLHGEPGAAGCLHQPRGF